jgi:hypothetical protein
MPPKGLPSNKLSDLTSIRAVHEGGTAQCKSRRALNVDISHGRTFRTTSGTSTFRGQNMAATVAEVTSECRGGGGALVLGDSPDHDP